MSKKKLVIILTYIKRAIKCTGNDISKVREIPKIESRESRDLVIERHEHKCSRRSTKIHGNDTNARVEKYSENFILSSKKT